MSKGIHLDDYHAGVARWLKGKFQWLKSVECYPEVKTPLPTPCAFFSVVGWEPEQHQPGNGQFAVTLHCETLLVVGTESAENQQYARNAAMGFSAGVQNSNFELPVAPAQVVSANPDALNPELDDYVVWAVNWVQKVTVGSTVFNEEVRDGIRFAINPENEDLPNEYRPLEVINAPDD